MLWLPFLPDRLALQMRDVHTAGEAALLIVVAQVWQAGETCRHRITHCKAWQRTMDSVTGRNRHRYGGLWSLLHSER